LDISWRRNELGHPRLGVIVPRHHHTAVDRNRVRRRIREIMRRRALPELDPIDIIVRARPPAYNAQFHQLAADLDQWLRSLST
jgi:ribonuclease P protein component